jgi:hypothetical protein
VGFGLLAAAAALAVAVLAVAAQSAPTCTSYDICVTSGHRPDPVAASTATVARNVAEDTSITNGSSNKLSLVKFVQAVPSGFAFVKDSLGVCSAAGGKVTCNHGQVLAGTTVSNTLVYSTPVLAAGTQATATFAGTWCWDGCNSHNPGATRVDSLDVSEPTLVKAVKGFDATYLLAGTAADLATGAAASSTDQLAGTWSIPGQAADIAATATETPNPPGFQQCPADGKACRSGDWFRASSPGTTSFSPVSTVVYTQFKDLIPKGTTESNYTVVYTECLPGEDPARPAGCPAVRLARCASAADLRCTEFVAKLPGGSYRVGVRIGSHNGYMK